jgi:hypothetical protein
VILDPVDVQQTERASKTRLARLIFHTKMEVLQRLAYGFRNFKNYRLRVRIMCSGMVAAPINRVEPRA